MVCATENYNLISPLFTAVYTHEVPARFTIRFLQKIGFKSSKMRELVTFLECFGFLDSQGFPTSLYTEFKKAQDPKSFVSACATKMYSDILPYITSIDASSLRDVFASRLKDVPENTLNLAVKTFLALNEYAPFYSTTAEPRSKEANFLKSTATRPINININLPETDNEKVYELLFKHLKELLR
jgi:hypothetical protein